MASGGSDQDAKDVLSKLLQIGMVAEYQSEFEILINRVTKISESLLKMFYISGLKLVLQCAIFRSNPKTLDEAFSLARAMEARFTNLQLLEFLRSNPLTLGEAFFRARITEAHFEDERSTTTIAKTNDLNTGVQKATIEKEETIKETSDTLTTLQSEVASFEAKRSLDANEKAKKAHTRVHGLEKQMEKLPIELQLDNNFREALETRSNGLEKKRLDLNPMLYDL
ncbi:hypothetical protein Tco_1020493 [Tanacetum coccineum]